ncbi:hypothetical protein [Nocardioides dongxiaopingii]|uniref:hypothetical protein n=1 Tax=Nocardioides dongxiaopingii TaxID=2576036 RepID=UPI0010C76775|nr:hypothetical protein [Nocardioides dongxiaopingii]
MNGPQTLPAAHPDADQLLAEIGVLITAATAEDRVLMGEVLLGVLQSIALFGSDDGILTARILRRVLDVALIATREDNRTTAKED